MTTPGPLATSARKAAGDALLRGMAEASDILEARIITARAIAHTNADAAEALAILEHAFNTGTLPPLRSPS